MVRTRTRGGFTMLENAIALVVLSVVATSVALTGSSQLRYFARSHEETVAGRAAASRIETLSASSDAFALGTVQFALGAEAAAALPSATATQTVTRVDAGLLCVETEVTWSAADGGTGRVRLTRLLAREEPR